MPKDNAKEFRIALEECWSDLKEAYWASNTNQAKDEITGCREYVSELLQVMYIKELSARTENFNKMASNMAIGNKKLEKLKDDIDKLIGKIDTITKVVESLGKVLSYIPLLPL